MPSEITYKDILLYKTEPCRNWNERGVCRYGKRCRYAHGPSELRPVTRSNQYKTKTCKAFHESGSCPYGVRCTFIHHPIDDKPTVVNQVVPSKEVSAFPGETTSITSSTNNHYIHAIGNNINANDIWENKLGFTSMSYHQPQYYQHQKSSNNFVAIHEENNFFQNQLYLPNRPYNDSLYHTLYNSFNSSD